MENDESTDVDLVDSSTSRNLDGDLRNNTCDSVDDTDIYFELGTYPADDGGTDAVQVSLFENNTKAIETGDAIPNNIPNEKNEDGGECHNNNDERKDSSCEEKRNPDQMNVDNCVSKKKIENSKSNSTDKKYITRCAKRTILKEKNSATGEEKSQGKEHLSAKCFEKEQHTAKKHSKNAHWKEEKKIARPKNNDIEFVFSRLMEIHEFKADTSKEPTVGDDITKSGKVSIEKTKIHGSENVTAQSDNDDLQVKTNCRKANHTRKEDSNNSCDGGSRDETKRVHAHLPEEDESTPKISHRTRSSKESNKKVVRISPRIQAMQALKLEIHQKKSQSSKSKNSSKDICNNTELPSKAVCISDKDQTKASNVTIEIRPGTKVMSEPFQAINRLLGNVMETPFVKFPEAGNTATSSETERVQDSSKSDSQTLQNELEVVNETPVSSTSSYTSPRKKLYAEPQALRRSPRKQIKNTQSLDLYEDFLITRNEEKKAKALSVKQSEIAAIQAKLAEAEERCKELDEDNKTLLTNMSSLWKTAMAQIQEKCRIIHQLEREKEGIIFRRAMRQVPRDELDRIISRIAAYNNEEITSFMESFEKETHECSCGATGKKPDQSKMTVKKIKKSVVGRKIIDLTESQARLLQLSLGKQGEKISTSVKINSPKTPKKRKRYQGKEESYDRYSPSANELRKRKTNNKSSRDKYRYRFGIGVPKYKSCRASLEKRFSKSVEKPCNKRKRTRTDYENFERHSREDVDRRKTRADNGNSERVSKETIDRRKSRTDFENLDKDSRENADTKKIRCVSTRSGRSEEEYSGESSHTKSRSDHYDRQRRKDKWDLPSAVNDRVKDLHESASVEHSSAQKGTSCHSTNRSNNDREFSETDKKSQTKHDNKTDASFRSQCVLEDKESLVRNSSQSGSQRETNHRDPRVNNLKISHQEALEASSAETNILCQSLYGQRMLKRFEMEKKNKSLPEECHKVGNITSISDDRTVSKSEVPGTNQRELNDKETESPSQNVKRIPNDQKTNQLFKGKQKSNTSYDGKGNFREDSDLEMGDKAAESGCNAVIERAVRNESSSRKNLKKDNRLEGRERECNSFDKETDLCLRLEDHSNVAQNFIPAAVIHKADKKSLNNSLDKSCGSNDKVFNQNITENGNSEERSTSPPKSHRKDDFKKIKLETQKSRSVVLPEELRKACEFQTSCSEEREGTVDDDILLQSNIDNMSQITDGEMGHVRICSNILTGITSTDNSSCMKYLHTEGEFDQSNLEHQESYSGGNPTNSHNVSIDSAHTGVNNTTDLLSSKEDPAEIELVCEVIVDKSTLSKLSKSRMKRINPVMNAQEITGKSSREMTLFQIQEEEKTLNQAFMETILDTIQIITSDEGAQTDWVDIETLSDEESSEYSNIRTTKLTVRNENLVDGEAMFSGSAEHDLATREKDTENLCVIDDSTVEHCQTNNREIMDEERSTNALECPRAMQMQARETSGSKVIDINAHLNYGKEVSSIESLKQSIDYSKDLYLDQANKQSLRILGERKIPQSKFNVNDYKKTLPKCVIKDISIGKGHKRSSSIENARRQEDISPEKFDTSWGRSNSPIDVASKATLSIGSAETKGFKDMTISNDTENEYINMPKEHSNIFESSTSREGIKGHVNLEDNANELVVSRSKVREPVKENEDLERQNVFDRTTSISTSEDVIERHTGNKGILRHLKNGEGKEKCATLELDSNAHSSLKSFPNVSETSVDTDTSGKYKNDRNEAVFLSKTKEVKEKIASQDKESNNQDKSKLHFGSSKTIPDNKDHSDSEVDRRERDISNEMKASSTLPEKNIMKLPRIKKLNKTSIDEQKIQMESHSPLLCGENIYKEKNPRNKNNSHNRGFSPPKTRFSPGNQSVPQNSERCPSQEKLRSKSSRSPSSEKSEPQRGSKGKTYVKADRKLSPLRNSDKGKSSHSNPERLVPSTQSKGSKLSERDGQQGRIKPQHRTRRERNTRANERRPLSPSPERPTTRSKVRSKESEQYERSRKRRRSPSPRRKDTSASAKDHTRANDTDRPTKRKKTNGKVSYREIFGTDDELEESPEQRPSHRSTLQQSDRRRMSQRLSSKERSHSPQDADKCSEETKRKLLKKDVKDMIEDLDDTEEKGVIPEKLSSKVLPVDKKLLQAKLHQLDQGDLEGEKEGELDEGEEKEEGELDEEEESDEELKKELPKLSENVKSTEATKNDQNHRPEKERSTEATNDRQSHRLEKVKSTEATNNKRSHRHEKVKSTEATSNKRSHRHEKVKSTEATNNKRSHRHEKVESTEATNNKQSHRLDKVERTEATNNKQSNRLIKNCRNLGNQDDALTNITKGDKGEKSSGNSWDAGESINKSKESQNNTQSTNSQISALESDTKAVTCNRNQQHQISKTENCVQEKNPSAKDKHILTTDKVKCVGKTRDDHSKSKPLKNLMEEDTTFYPNDLYQTKGPDCIPNPNHSSNSRTSGSDDTIDMIMKKHNESWPQDIVDSSDDSEMSLLQFIDDKPDAGEGKIKSKVNKDQVRELCNAAEAPCINEEGTNKFFRAFDTGTSSKAKVDDNHVTRECPETLVEDLHGSELSCEFTEENNFTEGNGNVNEVCPLEFDLQLSNSLTSPGDVNEGNIFQEKEDNEMNKGTQSLVVNKQNEPHLSSHFERLIETEDKVTEHNKNHIKDSGNHCQEKEVSGDNVAEAVRNIPDTFADSSEGSSILEQNGHMNLQQLHNEIQGQTLHLVEGSQDISQMPLSKESEDTLVSSSKGTEPFADVLYQKNLTPTPSQLTDEDSDSSDSGSSCSGCSKCGNEDSDSSSSDSSSSSANSDSNIGGGADGNLDEELQIPYPLIHHTEKSPDKSSRQTPVKSSHQSSHKSPRKTPCKTPRKTPCKKTNKTPAKSSLPILRSEKDCRHKDASGTESEISKPAELSTISNSDCDEGVKETSDNFNKESNAFIEHRDTKISQENFENVAQGTSTRSLSDENAQITYSNLPVSRQPVTFKDYVVRQKAKRPNLGVSSNASLIKVVHDENSGWSRPVTPAKEVETSFKKRKLSPTNLVEMECPVAKRMKVTSPDLPEGKNEGFSNSLNSPGKERNYTEMRLADSKIKDEKIVQIKRKNVRRQLNLGFSTSDSSRVMVTSVQSTSPQKSKAMGSPQKDKCKEHDKNSRKIPTER